MSLIKCSRCAVIVDSDDDPDCFVEQDRGGDRVLCEACRYELECDRENFEAMVSKAEYEAERRADR